jgi:Methyltransferase domain
MPHCDRMRIFHALFPEKLKRTVRIARRIADGVKFGRSLAGSLSSPGCAKSTLPNPLHDYFMAHSVGRGIWKWTHYFDIYHRHLAKFRGRDVCVVEIGVFSGGSLTMWREYFGPNALFYGVDLEPACSVYEDEVTRIFIGNQGDRQFWRKFKTKVPRMDVVIDDGSHVSSDQITTFEELFPALSPGGVYICEDIQGNANGFASFIYGLADTLNCGHPTHDAKNAERCLSFKTNGAQEIIQGINLYPMVAVVEKRISGLSELIAPKHGTEWQPFLGGGR